MTDIHLLGIRHHGPGSCRNILQELERIRPDLILLEGPAEAEALMPFVSYGQMKPPVALLGYQPDVPQNAVFYPFADFSPEWQALRYALGRMSPYASSISRLPIPLPSKRKGRMATSL